MLRSIVLITSSIFPFQTCLATLRAKRSPMIYKGSGRDPMSGSYALHHRMGLGSFAASAPDGLQPSLQSLLSLRI